MTDAVVDIHKAQIVANLKYLYRTGTLTRPAAGTKVSNGRGGFTTTPAEPDPIWLQRENDVRMLETYNVQPGQALIFVLNTLDEPVEGDVVGSDAIGRFTVKNVRLDPVSAVYHCTCDTANG